MTPAGFSPALLVLFVGMGIASSTDLRDGKIPNALTGTLIVLGLVIGVVQGSALASLAGIGLAFAMHFPLWMLRVEKAGDVKLLMATGALMGAGFAFETSIWCALLYLPVGLALLAAQGRLKNLLYTLRWAFFRARGLDTGPPPEPTMLRTAPIIAVAAFAAMSTSWFEITW